MGVMKKKIIQCVVQFHLLTFPLRHISVVSHFFYSTAYSPPPGFKKERLSRPQYPQLPQLCAYVYKTRGQYWLLFKSLNSMFCQARNAFLEFIEGTIHKESPKGFLHLQQENERILEMGRFHTTKH